MRFDDLIADPRVQAEKGELQHALVELQLLQTTHETELLLLLERTTQNAGTDELRWIRSQIDHLAGQCHRQRRRCERLALDDIEAFGERRQNWLRV